MEVELPTDEAVRTLRVQALLWTAVATMRCLYYTDWCECNDCEMHRMGIEIYDEDGMRRLEEEE